MKFFKSEAASGVILLLAAVLAMLVANSTLADGYASAFATPLGPLTVSGWINDGLMAIFFFVVGMEIKSELTSGALASRDRALLPAAGALGGMILPALIYLLFQNDRGWGIPMATDIAFAVGVLSLFRVPTQLKVFLLALAIVDDLGAVLVIALFYTSELHWLYLGLACAVGVACTFVRGLWFAILGVLLWWLVHHSGIHATVAGCALGFMVRDPKPLIERLHGWSSFVIMPIFAFANAGLRFGDVSWSDVWRVPLVSGISYGLLIGKPIGILLACWIVVRLGWARLEVSWRSLAAVACLGGIGFTMSLFIAGLALSDPHAHELAKLGIVKGSLLSACVGGVWLTLLMSRGRLR
jgi:NhaA family Na+:H+ antiporter